LIATPELSQGSKNIPHHEFKAALNTYSKVSGFLRFKLIYSYLFAVIAGCQLYDLAVTMKVKNKRIFPFSPCFVMYEFFYE
jgi:hypothetical protein